MSSQKYWTAEKASDSDKYYFVGEELLEGIAFERLKIAFCLANLREEERLHGNSFIQLCELTKDNWNRNHSEKYTLENFSVVLEKWLSSEATGNSFEADIWRRNIPNFIFSIIYSPVGKESLLQDYVSVLFEKGCKVESVFKDSMNELDNQEFNDLDLSNPILKNEMMYLRYYLTTIAKILLEYEKQSNQMYDYALRKVIKGKLYTTAEQILFVIANAGGFASTSLISRIFSHLGKEHTNFNDDIKQLCDEDLLIKQGTKKSRIFLLPPLMDLMTTCQLKET